MKASQRATAVIALAVASWFVLVHPFGNIVNRMSIDATVRWYGAAGGPRTVAQVASVVASIAYLFSFLALVVIWATVFIAVGRDGVPGAARWRAAMLVFPFGTTIASYVLNFVTPHFGYSRVPAAGYPFGRLEPNVLLTDLRNVLSVGGWISAVIIALEIVRRLPSSTDLVSRSRRPVAALGVFTVIVAAGSLISYLAERHVPTGLSATPPPRFAEAASWLLLPIGAALAASFLIAALIAAQRWISNGQNSSQWSGSA